MPNLIFSEEIVIKKLESCLQQFHLSLITYGTNPKTLTLKASITTKADDKNFDFFFFIFI